MLLSIIIPAYNEERRIGETLARYWDFFQKESVEFCVIVNGSRDNTIGIARAFEAAHPGKVMVMEIQEKIGKGGAVHSGFLKARGDYIGFVDADGATDPKEFKRVVEAAYNYDGAIASRWKRGSVVMNRSWYRTIASWGFRLVVKILFWLPYADTQCGAKVFNRRLVDQLIPQLHVHNMAFDVELLHRARRQGFSVIEVPTRWTDKSGSTLVGSPAQFALSAIRMFITLLSIRFRS
ncbi:MAG: glycosyltransferase family 2 protein [Candidatus Kerfeldbacteria bacterium]|nr:glycosyltransferase family 2 protein [Candidatus Kerfeldbacteria bacterium]